jgi:hypothetical protein
MERVTEKHDEAHFSIGDVDMDHIVTIFTEEFVELLKR